MKTSLTKCARFLKRLASIFHFNNIECRLLSQVNLFSQNNDDVVYHEILLGGDQLTYARVRGAQSMRVNHENSAAGFIPVVEDWHAKMTFMKVI